MEPSTLLAADSAIPLWDDEPIEGAFQFDDALNKPENAVVASVERPWLFGYKPTSSSSSTSSQPRAILILGGGGYIELMAGREGVAVARWLTSLGFHAYVLVHRFPNAKISPQAPLDDARRALRLIAEKGFKTSICGLSSGGHLAASLLSHYPTIWTEKDARPLPELEFAIVGYAPISTNAKGRTVVENKQALEPPEKQAFYDAVQPDVQLVDAMPPMFIVYAGNDPVVPVANAWRLAEGVMRKGAKVELHIFGDAPHGFALDTKGLPVTEWPGMCEKWLVQLGVLGSI
ncbi:endo-1,4-beta-xylanase B [Dothidotthia symphoricarpi CBS 119687]|uniref:Endo-1,4-beta-xylanase B n=1 Tax=Dothidotthia symphoricarpi CBS 119687 TaxID=1392245 RepID=A0A6A6ADE3_9PLEO|nr:endo-1,4-beta-xylanase B [Dothidotthia symphoricarpi CBS 119687]KAF2128761.1 endo-1,4-beta-xylanase B [Dothidotthia symphoricarpi CBS 119687]